MLVVGVGRAVSDTHLPKYAVRNPSLASPAHARACEVLTPARCAHGHGH